MGIVALSLARFFVPTEGVIEGVSLWIACAWLAALAAWGLDRFRNRGDLRFRPGWIDFFALLLIGGHCLSVGMVFYAGGDLRAAVNSLWEWLALAATWFLLRDVLASSAARSLFVRSLLVTLVTLALLGLWQYAVWYPQVAAEHQELLVLAEKMDGGGALSPEDRASYERLTRLHGTEMFTRDAGARRMLLDRAQRSTEPIGFFALANSFAALILAGFVMSLDGALRCVRRQGPRSELIVWLAAVGLLGVCLLLEKSRTAAVAAAVAGTLVLISQLLSGRESRQRLVLWTGAGLVAGAVAVALVSAAGGLDREVVTESPKSLQYRLDYWRNTLALLRDHPMWGTGPGNFRQHYVQYMTAESTEEIRDPHNLFLDAWANGGLLGLAGLAGLLATFAAGAWRRIASSVSEPPLPAAASSWKQLLLCGLAGPGLVLGETLLLEARLDARLLAVAAVWLAVATVASRWNIESVGPSAFAAAAVAVVVHLLGAGGMGMPAIVQLLFSLMILGATTPEASRLETVREQRPLAISLVAAAALLLSVWTAFIPTLTTSALMSQGATLLLMQRDARGASTLFQQAAQADRLAPAPWVQLAAAQHSRWQGNRGDIAAFDAAQEALDEARSRDPFSSRYPLLQAEWFLERFAIDPRPEFAERAAELSGVALSRSPTDVRAMTIRALAHAKAGRPDHDELYAALMSDNRNHQLARLEKVLSRELRAELEQETLATQYRVEYRRHLERARDILRRGDPLPPGYRNLFSDEELQGGQDRR